MNVSIALAMYIAERNKGVYKDYFMTFSERPQLVKIQGANIVDKVNNISNADWGMNTNIEKALNTILDVAVKNNLSNDEVVKKLYIISDMQFDSCVDDGNNPTAYEMINKKYREAGYPVPKLVFWNVAQSDRGNLPVTQHKYGAVLVGGCQVGLFEQILSGKTPVDFMFKVINSERYLPITLSE